MRCPNCYSRKVHEYNGFLKCERCGHEFPVKGLHETKIISDQRIGDVGNGIYTLKGVKLQRIRYHKNVFIYPIIRDNPNKHLPIIPSKPMKGWFQEWSKTTDYKAQRTPKSIVISLNKHIFRDLSKPSDIYKVDKEIKAIVDKFAKEIEGLLDIELDFNNSRRKSEEIALEDIKIPQAYRYEKELTKDVYPDWTLESKADKIIQVLEKQNEIVAPNIIELSQNMKTHVEIMQNISNGILNLNEGIRELRESMKKPTIAEIKVQRGFPKICEYCRSQINNTKESRRHSEMHELKVIQNILRHKK